MDNEKRYQVFVSSTYLDLQEERREVIQALLEMDCLPASMELFPAANEDQWSLIQSVIDQSDYYVVIVGGRYGSLTSEGISYTEKEYDYAVSKGIPVLGFLPDNPENIPSGKTEIDSAAIRRLEAFANKIRQRLVRTYSSPENLGSVLSRSLMGQIKREPRPGWVRGEFAMTPETQAEVARLKTRIAELESELTKRSGAPGEFLDLSYEHGDELVELAFDVTESDPFDNGSTKRWYLKYSWKKLLGILGPHLLHPTSESMLRSKIEEDAESKFRNIDEYLNAYKLYTHLSDQAWARIIVQFRALGLVIHESNGDGFGGGNKWRLTPAGDRFHVGMQAKKKSLGPLD